MSETPHPRLASVVIALCAAALLALGWLAVDRVRTGGTARPWTEPEVSGSTVDLTYTDGSCRSFDHVEVEETASTVTLTVTTRTFALSCDDANRRYVATATLDAPLADRRLVDGAR